MYPEYKQGDWVLVNRLAYFLFEPRPGDDIVFFHPDKDDFKMLKRIANRSGKKFYVRGINEEYSTDSRAFGAITKSDIVGKVCYRHSV